MAPPRWLPELTDDATEAILLRIPPEEPAPLFRASLVCKHWRSFLVDPAFARRYREFHRTPPMLGFFRNPLRLVDRDLAPRFVPTSLLAPPVPQPLAFDFPRWRMLSCRHGRFLVGVGYIGLDVDLVVWDPVTGHWQKLPRPSIPICFSNSCAVLCSVSCCSCNHHLHCQGEPFLVVSVRSCRLGTRAADGRLAWACVYSSETCAWSTPTCVYLGVNVSVDHNRSGAVVRDGIYFALTRGERILKFDLVENCLSVIHTPDVYRSGVVLMAMEDGSLGLAGIKCSSLHLWSWKLDAEGSAGWVQCRVIDLEKLFPDNKPCNQYRVTGFAEGLGVIFVGTDVGVFMMELKSGRKRKVSEPGVICTIVPLMGFYTPDCGSSKLPSQ